MGTEARATTWHRMGYPASHLRRSRRGSSPMNVSTKKAFTLIELLVVIAIIAILAAILFPVFAQAKLAAKKAADLSNAKQIGTATQLYLGDADDTNPMVVYTTDGNGVIPGTGTDFYSVFDALQPYSKNKDLFTSPADPKAIKWSAVLPATNSASSDTVLGYAGAALGKTLTSSSNFNFAGFAPNFRIFEDTAVGAPLACNGAVVNNSSIPAVADTTLFYNARYLKAGGINADLDSTQKDYVPNDDSFAFYNAYKTPPSPFNRLNFPGTARYGNTVNVTFADTHAKSVNRKGKLPGTAPDLTKTAAPTAAVNVYHLPYDLNGIPDVVAESTCGR